MRDVRWERMFRDELEEAFGATPLLYLPYGICEPHGPENVLGVDGHTAHGIACRAAEAYGGIVAPAFFWHIHELSGEGAWAVEAIGEVERAWLTALPPWIFFKQVCYHIRAADALGFHATILLTGHGGPLVEDFQRVIELVQPHVGTQLCATPFKYASAESPFESGPRDDDHGGRGETSLLWALEPGGVDLSRMPAGGQVPQPRFGTGTYAHLADRRAGERMVASAVSWLGAKARALLAEYESARPEQRLRTFEQVEVLWEEVVQPELAGFRTMQLLWEGQHPVPRESVWFANWAVPERG